MQGAIGCLLVAALLAGNGPATTRNLETTVQDDALMLHRSEAQVRQAARQMADLGADRLRVTAGWSALAPSPRAKKKPEGDFRADDSGTYPADGWRKLDRAVTAAVAAGLAVQIDVAFWAPRWATKKRSPGSLPDRQRWEPSAAEFGEFAKAVARRYSGGYPDPARGGKAPLPAVRMYTTWNEPNEPSFLMPQWKRTAAGGWRTRSPHVYRRLHNAGYAAIKSISPHSTVLVGGTSAKGGTRPGVGGVPPLRFLREMACTNVYGGHLAVPECRGYEPLKADGFSHHPYSLETTPGTSDPDADDAPIADLERLQTQISALAAAGRIASDWPLYVTEYGYESRPPDPYGRYSPEQQAAYLGWATWLAYRRPGVPMFAQFLLRDIDAAESGFPEDSRRRWRDWQTGLLYADGTPKPAAQAFKLPFHAQAMTTPGGPALLVFGGVRPGRGRQFVRVERFDEGSGRWLPERTVVGTCQDAGAEFATNPDGYFVHTAPWRGPGRYRLAWNRPDGTWEYGAEVPVTADEPLAVPDAGARQG